MRRGVRDVNPHERNDKSRDRAAAMKGCATCEVKEAEIRRLLNIVADMMEARSRYVDPHKARLEAAERNAELLTRIVAGQRGNRLLNGD